MASSELPRPAWIGNDISQAITEILHGSATNVEETSYRLWQFRIPGSKRNSRLRLTSRWFSLSLPLRAFPRAIDCKLIDNTFKHNARFNGSPRIIGSPAGRERQLVIEIPADLLPYDCVPEVEELIAAEVASLGDPRGKNHSQAEKSSREPRLSCAQLESIFEESDWPVRNVDDFNIEVPLEIPGSYYAADLSQDNIGLRLNVPIFTNEYATASSASRSAISVLLWAITSRVRMVKPVLCGKRLGLEVALPSGLIMAASVAHGCAALACTLQQFVREAELLIADDHLAQLYLSNLGFQKAA